MLLFVFENVRKRHIYFQLGQDMCCCNPTVPVAIISSFRNLMHIYLKPLLQIYAIELFFSAIYFNFTKMCIFTVIIIQNVLEIYNNVLNSSNTPGWMELQEVNDTCDLCLVVLYKFSIRSIVHKVNFFC